VTEQTTPPGEISKLPKSVQRRTGLAAAALFFERLWPALWPAWGILAVFVSLSLLDAWSYLPLWAHIIVVCGFAAAFLISLVTKTRHISWPTHAESLRRIEVKSGFSHRPLEGLDDDLAHKAGQDSSDTEASELWQAHRERLRRQIKRLRIGTPRSDMPRRDPYAVRALVLMVLLISVAIGGADWNDRLRQAFQPSFTGSEDTQLVVDAWIDPPAYTGRAPIFLTRAIGTEMDSDAYKVPEGSKLIVRFTGRETAATLNIWPSSLTRETGTTEIEPLTPQFEEVAPSSFEHSEELREDIHVTVKDGGQELYTWRIKTLTDQAPVIAFPYPDEVEATETQKVRIPYTIRDDYGVVSALAELKLAGEETSPIDWSADRFEAAPPDESPDDADVPVKALEPIRLELPVRSQTDGREDGEIVEDLTAHPWAGLDVRVQLRAEDEIGQIGLSESVNFTLPERIFTDPLAKAIIEQRKWLAQNPDDGKRVAAFIDAFTEVPEKYYGDMTAYLLMRNAYYKLDNIKSEDDLQTLFELLWDIALRFEQGDLARMAQNVDDLQRELMEALAQNRPQDEIDRLIQALRDSIAEYLAELARQGMEDMQRGQMPPNMGGGGQGGQSIEDLLQALEDRLRIGDMEGARRILAEIMDQLENTQFGGFSNDGESFAIPGLEDLGDMIGRQRGLMDRTFRESQQGQGGQQQDPNRPSSRPGQNGMPGMPGQQRQGQNQNPGGMQQGDQAQSPSGGGRGLREDQNTLQQDLGSLLDDLRNQGVEVPGALDRALRAMEDAAERLARGDADGALERQNEAVDQLREGAQSMAQAVLDELDRADQANGGNQDNGARDPLGRPQAGSGPEYGNRVKVPEERELQRARDILEELRRRASELGRPAIELEYLERLLKRF